MKVRLTMDGTTPLMLHNVRLASPMNAYAKRLKALNGKRNKTDEDRLEIARVEWEGGLYYDETLGPYVPAQNILRTLINAGRLSKQGMKIERGVSFVDYMFPILWPDHSTDLDKLWGNGESQYVDIRPVTVQRNKVDRCRPIFPQWRLEAELEVDPSVLEFEELVAIAETAGRLIGTCEYRLVYGKFRAGLERL